MDFNEVIGQKEAISRLKELADTKRVPHAMMLCGPQGCGKMAIAIAFASYILTHDIDDELRLRQANVMLSNYEHPDLHFSYPVIRPAGTSSEHKMISDDFSKEWREMLKKDAYFTMDHWLAAMNAANQQALIGAGESDDLIHKLSRLGHSQHRSEGKNPDQKIGLIFLSVPQMNAVMLLVQSDGLFLQV